MEFLNGSCTPVTLPSSTAATLPTTTSSAVSNISHCSDTATVIPTATQSSISSAQLSRQSVIAATPSSCTPKSTNSHSLEVNK